MMRPAIPWWVPQMTGQEQYFIAEVLSSNYVNEGDLATRFEQEIAERLEVKYAIAVTSGTAALFLSLAGLGIGHGDEVIVPDVTFIATANAVSLAGATPVLVDVDPATLTIAPEAIERAITHRTRAIMPVHVSGRAADMQTIVEIANRHSLAIVEDAAESLLSRADAGRYQGTIGRAGCFSFSPNKTITTGQGGMIVTDDDDLHVRLRELKDQGRPTRGTGGDDVHHSIGFNFKFTNLQAAIGLAQLSALSERLDRQRRIYQIYAEHLQGCAGLRLPGFAIDRGTIPQWTDALTERRDALDTYLRSYNIHCRRFWFPIHTQKPYRLSDDAFPNSTRLMPQAIWLPSSFTLSDDDVLMVCERIKDFLAA